MAPRKRSLFGAFLAASTALYLLTIASGWRRLYFRHTYEDTSSTTFDEHANTHGKRVLLVSALYPLEKSKHSQEDYKVWLRHFLGEITTDIYFYAPPSLHDLVLQTRTQGLYLGVNTSYPTAFSIPPLRGQEGSYEAMHAKDRERARHSPDLYAIWNAKPFFLNEAVREMRDTWRRDYDYAFWVDAGSFREKHAYKRWPEVGTVQALFAGENRAESIFIPLYDLPHRKFRRWREDMGPVDDEVSEGSFFGGSPTAIEWYTSTFYSYHDHYLSLGYFVGKDQTLINALLLLFPRRFITAWQRNPVLRSVNFWTGRCGSYWYYYQFLLSNPMERREMEKIWKDRPKSSLWKYALDWIAGSDSCPISDHVSVDTMLAQAFGFRAMPRQVATVAN